MTQNPDISSAVCVSLINRKMTSATNIIVEKETWLVSDGISSSELACYISYKNNDRGFMTPEVTWGRDGLRISRLEKSRAARINNRKLNQYQAKFVNRAAHSTRWVDRVCYADETWTVSDGLTLGQIDCTISFRIDTENAEFSLVTDTFWGTDLQKERNYLPDGLRSHYLGLVDHLQPFAKVE